MTILAIEWSFERSLLSSGPLAPAIQASSAIPVAFTPVQLYGRILVDGGLISATPIEPAREVHPKWVVAVDLFGSLGQATPVNMFQIAERSMEIMMHTQTQPELSKADVVIIPDLGNISIFSEGANELIYEAGRQAALKAIPKIKKLISNANL